MIELQYSNLSIYVCKHTGYKEMKEGSARGNNLNSALMLPEG